MKISHSPGPGLPKTPQDLADDVADALANDFDEVSEDEDRWKADDCPMISWENNGKKHVFSMSLAVVKKNVQYFQPSMALSSTSTFRLLRTQHRTRRLSCSCQMVGWHSMNWCYKLAVSLRQNGVCWILNSCISFHFTRDTRVIVFVPCKQ